MNNQQSFKLSTKQKHQYTFIGIITITLLIVITNIYFSTKGNNNDTQIQTTNTDEIITLDSTNDSTKEPIVEITKEIETNNQTELPSETYMNDSDFPEIAMFTISDYDITIHFPTDYIIENQLNFDMPAYHLNIMLEDKKHNEEPLKRPLIIIATTDYFADWATIIDIKDKDYETINVAGNEYNVIQYSNGESYGSIGWYEKTSVAKIDENLYVMIFNYSSSAIPSCAEDLGCTEKDYSYTMSEEQIETALKILEQAIFIKK